MRAASRIIIAAALIGSGTVVGQTTAPTPPGTPVTADKAMLGKALFWDEQLSSTRATACGTCHFPENGGSDPRSFDPEAVHPGADGVFGTADDRRTSPGVIASEADGSYTAVESFGIRPQATPRKAPSMINAAFFSNQLFWDGRAGGTFVDPLSGQVVLPADAALESLAVGPPVNDVEMGHLGRDWNEVVARIRQAQPLAMASDVPGPLDAWIAGRSYDALFQQAFGSPGVTPARFGMAVATYMRTLIANQTPIDRFLAGNPGVMTEAELRGQQVFKSSNCSTCHRGRVLGGNPAGLMFANTGVRPIDEDRGRGEISGVAADEGAFKIPVLSNVGLRAPFFHDGSKSTLAEVVEFYDRGGDFKVNQHQAMQPLGLTVGQKADLVAFLQGATLDPRVATAQPPFDRPTLHSETARVPVSYGLATAGTAGVLPQLIAVEPPMLGNPSWTLGFSDGLAGAAGLLMIGDARETSGRSLLGVALAVDPMRLQVVPLAALRTSANTGFTSLSLPIPNVAPLGGAAVYLQAAFVDAGASQGFSATAGAQATLFAPR